MVDIKMEDLEEVAKKRGVPVYVVFDEILRKLLAQLN